MSSSGWRCSLVFLSVESSPLVCFSVSMLPCLLFSIWVSEFKFCSSLQGGQLLPLLRNKCINNVSVLCYGGEFGDRSSTGITVFCFTKTDIWHIQIEVSV
ncbi:hypothetical protein F7725_011019 [Dissostichus mawsoni]|uniref:Uncharacterized protein n=1 Tax=Dissostichus mawsoni TaxID=36200 RepID=A0A7J5ZBW0_DISMA|nr:hypothetical protein F7725_011019 [Dissostichus mawsoni]